MTRRVIALFVLCALAIPAAGQITGPGITWSGTSGNFVGTFGFQCEPLQVLVVPGETVTVAVWGDHLEPFLVFASFAVTSCQTIPGVMNGLVLDHPASIVGAGILNQANSCGGPCPSGFEDMTVLVASNLPSGTSISIQALTVAVGQPAFTSAITALVR